MTITNAKVVFAIKMLHEVQQKALWVSPCEAVYINISIWEALN